MTSPTSRGRWSLPEVTGLSPSPRGGLNAVALGKKVICFGGSDRKPLVYDDVWYLDVSGKEFEWVKVTPSYKNCKITPRSGASLTAINGKLYLYGGQEPTSETRYRDIFCLDPDMWEWTLVEARGTIPPARHSHIACNLADQCLVIHGGSGLAGTLGDVCIFNVEQSSWTLVPETTQGPSPSPREMHCGCMIDKGQSLLIYGGRDPEVSYEQITRTVLCPSDKPRLLDAVAMQGKILCDAAVLDVKEMRWKTIEPTPFSRCAHSIVTSASDEVDPPILIYGGFGGEEVEGDVLRIDPSSLEIEVVRRGPRENDLPGSVPQPRFAHAAVSLVMPGGEAVMLVVGGVNQTADLIDIALFTLSSEPIK